jgi:SAM-dependent methyltransferase
MENKKDFFTEKAKLIFEQKKDILDIGGGLRIDKKRNNRYDSSREWLIPYLSKVNYQIMDPVPDYNPDIVGDIHAMPFSENAYDAICCMAILEHVENPIKAVQEMHRVLRPGGFCLCYVPFLFYYHAQESYYKDYWRFTKDILPVLFKDFSQLEIKPVRGAIETWIKLSPLGRYAVINRLAKWLDKISAKDKSNQVSAYLIFAVK